MKTLAPGLPTFIASALVLASGCGTSNNANPTLDAAVTAPADMSVAPPDLATPWDFATDPALVTMRPYKSYSPVGYDAAKPTPLVLLLHGLGDNGDNFSQAFQMDALADSKGFLYAAPSGTMSFLGTFWNATDAFAALNSKVDDVAYLNAVINDMMSKYNVDATRVYILGYSNGGFMAHRMACDDAPRFAAIVSMAGAQFSDITLCKPAVPVNVLQIHGVKDVTVPYNGGTVFGDMYPQFMALLPKVVSAHQTILDWVMLNGCDPTVDSSAAPLMLSGLGTQTHVEKWNGCKPGGAAELWSIDKTTHQFQGIDQKFFDAVWGFMSSHKRQ